MTSFGGSISKGLCSRIAMGKALACVWGLLLTLPVLAVADSIRFNIAAQPLPTALKMFAAQANMQLLYRFEVVESATANAVVGDFDKREALEILLNGTGLEAVYSKDDAATIRPTKGASRPAASNSITSATSVVSGTNGDLHIAQANAPVSKGSVSTTEHPPIAPNRATENPAIFEVLVTAEKLKTLNMDIKRSEDDAQPYVVFEREIIQRSGAVNIEDFLKQRLPMNTLAGSRAQSPNINGNISQIGLRGLGANQTLILIDGHRLQSINLLGNINQGDLNGIPLAAVERIEVLPTTASGIYGGGATGGVINVVLRRDYAGLDAKVTYENTFDSAAPGRRIDLASGFALGVNSILLAGSYSDSDPLQAFDRDFIERGRDTILANNPGFLLNAANPPLGATTNIRSAGTGANLNLVLDDGTPLNSPVTSIPVGYPGAASDGGQALLANAGRYNLALANTAQGNGGDRIGLLNGPTVESAMVTVRRRFSSRVDAFIDLSASNNEGHSPTNDAGFFTTYLIPADAPNNPFAQSVRVTIPVGETDGDWKSNIEDRRAIGGVILQLAADWQAEADYSWGQSTFRFQDQPTLNGTTTADTTLAVDIAAGAVDVLRDTNAFPVDYSPYVLFPSPSSTPFKSTLTDATLRLAGPVGSLPAGVPNVSMLLEHREDELEEATAGGFTRLGRSQTIKSAYIETLLPLISGTNRIAGIQELELQLAARFDEYTVHGGTLAVPAGSSAQVLRVTNKSDSVDPTIGLRYQPVRDATLRVSYGTGFLPPSVNQLGSNPPLPTVTAATDPRRGNTPIGAFIATTGGNPDARPEESESWSAGVILTPRFIPGFRLSVDYTRIEKRDNLVTLSPQQVVDNESLFPGRVVRGPAADDPVFGVGMIIGIDTTIANIAQAKVEAYDLQFDYRLETQGFGNFNFFAVATRHMHHETQLLPGLPVVENVGITSLFPLKFKANAGLAWAQGPWTLNWMTRYYDSYKLTNATQVANQGSGGVIPSQMYHDAFASWTASTSIDSALFARTEIQLGVKNVFDEEPPFDASNNINSFFYSTYGDPRLATYFVSLRKSF